MIITSSYNQTYTIQAGQELILEHSIMPPAAEKTVISVTFHLHAHAQLTYHPVILGGTIDLQIIIIMQGQHACAQINGTYILSGSDALTISTRQAHEVGHAQSMVQMNGIVSDAASVVYAGMIYIAPDAAGTQADQHNKTILLSPQAQARSIPSIEVLNHEVQCGHGSAISYLDPEQLWYAIARGMTDEQARRMLVDGFLASSLDEASMTAKKLAKDHICL